MMDLLAALGLAIALEGVLYALFPDQMRRLLTGLLEYGNDVWQRAGLVAVIVGVAVVWLVRG